MAFEYPRSGHRPHSYNRPVMAKPVNNAPPAAAVRAVGGVRRLRAAWRALAPEQRLVGFAALGLLVTMFLPWYSTASPGKVAVAGRLPVAHDHQSAIGA